MGKHCIGSTVGCPSCPVERNLTSLFIFSLHSQPKLTSLPLIQCVLLLYLCRHQRREGGNWPGGGEERRAPLPAAGRHIWRRQHRCLWHGRRKGRRLVGVNLFVLVSVFRFTVWQKSFFQNNWPAQLTKKVDLSPSYLEVEHVKIQS